VIDSIEASTTYPAISSAALDPSGPFLASRVIPASIASALWEAHPSAVLPQLWEHAFVGEKRGMPRSHLSCLSGRKPSRACALGKANAL
jgi:hypothetical protein